jgi:hypothetical protein
MIKNPMKTLRSLFTILGVAGLAVSASAQPVVNVTATDDEAAETWRGQTPNSGNVRFTRTGSTTSPLVVWIKLGGTAVRNSDYAFAQNVSTSVTIPAGQAHLDLSVNALDDSATEAEETIRIDLEEETPNNTPVPYAIGGQDRAEVRLRDNESLPQPAFVSVSGLSSASEGAGGAPIAGAFRFARTGNTTAALIVTYSVQGNASPGADYSPLSGSVLIPAGSAFIDVSVTPVDDADLEGDESVSLTLLPSTCAGTFPPAADCYAFGASVTGELTIQDNEAPPVRAVVDVAALNDAAEDSGGSPASGAFRFTRSANLDMPLTVVYSVGGTATPSSDYAALSGSVEIPAGVESIDVAVVPVDDQVLEPGDAVRVMILPPSCPELFPPSTCYLVGASPSASVAILDNEIAPVAMVSGWQNTNVAGLPASGFGSFAAYSTNGHIVAYQVRVDGALRFTGNTDYPNPPAPGTPFSFDFAITNLTAGIHRVQAVVTDNLGNSGSGTNSFTVVVIPPPPPTINFYAIDDDAAETEPGETPNTGRFRVVITGSPDLAFSFYSFAGTGREGVDYTITYEPGVYSTNGITNIWSQDIVVTPVDDLITESTETVDLQLCFVVIAWIYGVGAPIGTECSSFGAIVNIRDNDANPPHPIVRVTASDVDAQEVSLLSGDAQNPGAFTISRTAPATNDLPVYYTLTGSARNGSDYSTVAGVTVISNGSLSATIPVAPLYDVLVEGNETVTLTLRPVSSAPLYLLDPGVNNSATVVIRDYAPTNIPVVRIKVTDSQAIEQPSTSPYASFRIERSGNNAAEFALPYDISGTAVNGLDYVALPGVATFVAGGSFVAVTVIPYLDGETNEPDETVVLTLTPPPSDVFPPPYLLGASGTGFASAGATIREDAPPRTRPLDRFERARRLRFPGRYRIVPLPVLPAPTVPYAEPAVAKSWAVEASSDFVTWQEIGETEDPEEFLDVDAGTSPQRFYRFRELPATTP